MVQLWVYHSVHSHCHKLSLQNSFHLTVLLSEVWCKVHFHLTDEGRAGCARTLICVQVPTGASLFPEQPPRPLLQREQPWPAGSDDPWQCPPRGRHSILGVGKRWPKRLGWSCRAQNKRDGAREAQRNLGNLPPLACRWTWPQIWKGVTCWWRRRTGGSSSTCWRRCWP